MTGALQRSLCGRRDEALSAVGFASLAGERLQLAAAPPAATPQQPLTLASLKVRPDPNFARTERLLLISCSLPLAEAMLVSRLLICMLYRLRAIICFNSPVQQLCRIWPA